MTRHALLILIFGGILFAVMARACAHPAESQPAAPPSATWAPGQVDPRGMAWLPVTGATVKDRLVVGAWGTWSWVDAAMASGKPTAAPTPTQSRTPTATRQPRATRTARPTGTPTQGNMLPPPTCGAGTVEPGLWTPWPACYPHGPSFTPTPTVTDTPTAYPRDTAPASATSEPTPTPRVKATPAAAVLVPELYLYRFPILLVSRARR